MPFLGGNKTATHRSLYDDTVDLAQHCCAVYCIFTSTEFITVKSAALIAPKSAPHRLVSRQSHLRSLLIAELNPEKIAFLLTKQRCGPSPAAAVAPEEPVAQEDDDGGGNTKEMATAGQPPSLIDTNLVASLRDEIANLTSENDRLQSLCTSIHAKHRQNSLHVSISSVITIP